MKHKLLLMICLFTITSSFAQEDFQILEQNVPFHKLATSFSTNIIGANEDFVIYNWQKFIERHKGVSYVISIGEGDVELESNHVVCPFLNNQTVDIHTRFEPNDTKTGVLLTIWIEMKDGTFYASKTDKDSGENIKKWLLSFHNELMELNRTH